MSLAETLGEFRLPRQHGAQGTGCFEFVSMVDSHWKVLNLDLRMSVTQPEVGVDPWRGWVRLGGLCHAGVRLDELHGCIVGLFVGTGPLWGWTEGMCYDRI